MALEGTLRDFSLADIFQLIGLQRKTGVLTLRGKEDTVSVTFLDGKVVGSDSLNRRLESRLGHVLIKNGTLTVEQLNRALEIQKETLQRIGFILTHYGIISADALRGAIQLQILQVIYRLFRWKDAEYHFSQETTIEYDKENVTPISAESILMEGARMIDEWPIIEKRIRSYDMVFRRKQTNLEFVVVGSEEADEIDFDESPAPARKKKAPAAAADKIRISEEEKAIYDLVSGTATVGDIVESSRLSEFDTNKALYELLTRDLIEEVRKTGVAAVAEQPPVDETAVAETPVPLPLVLALAAAAAVAVVISFVNPLNSLGPFRRDSSSIEETKKAISLQRVQEIGRAIEEYNLASGHLPARLQELAPAWVAPNILQDPWGNAYRYLQQPEKYLVIGFSADGKPDTALFLQHSVDSSPVSAQSKPQRGGIELVPDGN
jgi:Domain of unknown function (DUF4388)/Type II secretion system (T2SS), protein G